MTRFDMIWLMLDKRHRDSDARRSGEMSGHVGRVDVVDTWARRDLKEMSNFCYL